jgi:hypothetical protein
VGRKAFVSVTWPVNIAASKRITYFCMFWRHFWVFSDKECLARKIKSPVRETGHCSQYTITLYTDKILLY